MTNLYCFSCPCSRCLRRLLTIVCVVLVLNRRGGQGLALFWGLELLFRRLGMWMCEFERRWRLDFVAFWWGFVVCGWIVVRFVVLGRIRSCIDGVGP